MVRNEYKELRDYITENYSDLDKLSNRFYCEGEIANRGRNEYERDYSRILYSPSFRRLQGKMQLLGVKDDKFYRNRLTHSLEVAQIARSIAQRLKEFTELDHIYVEDIYVVEACAFAHDIGNPPFGHHGERILNKLADDVGGFEGNAQTLKVLMDLEKKLPEHKGLNLTKRTLLGVTKYFNKREQNSSKFIYNDNYDAFAVILKEAEIKIRTLDVQIIDLADEIAYAAHDLEDALSMRLFTIDEFLFEFKHFIDKEKTEQKSALDELIVIIEKAKDVASKANNYHSSEEYGLLFRKEITSNLVHKLIMDINVVELDEKAKNKTGTQQTHELGFKTLRYLASGLKDFTFKCINRTNAVQLYEKQGEKIIKSLYEVFLDPEFNKNDLLIPVEFRSEDKDIQKRLIIDYIAGMMDSYAIRTYESLFGSSSLDKIYSKEYFKDYR